MDTEPGWPPNIDKILFLVQDTQRARRGFTWRIWPAGTSFYVKCVDPAFRDMKVSLHGPDARHNRQFLKFGFDSSATPGQSHLVGRHNLPAEFEGKQLSRDVRHVMRFRHDWTMFHSDVPSAPTPGTVKKLTTSQASVCPPPDQMFAVDVDLFLCEREPFWPDEEQARADNLILGPIENDAGQFLTGVVRHHNALAKATVTPDSVTAPKPDAGEQIVRGLAFGVDREILWINEVKFGCDTLAAAAGEDAGDSRAVAPDTVS